MQDRTGEIARRLRIDPGVLALVLGAPWTRAGGDDDPAADREPPERSAPGRMYVGVPSPSELRDLDLPPDRLRHFGLSPDELRAGGYTDGDLRSVGLLPPGAAPGGSDTGASLTLEWFVVGQPVQLMLAVPASGPPQLARPEPGQAGGRPTLEPVDVREVPDLAGCADPDGAPALAVREARDGLLRRARRRLLHCPVCLRQVHRADTAEGLCHDCATEWLGILF
ncbi:hypothetical protein ACLFMI_15570 [Pseudonocardia nantongensis]|uniref:hypothetical protein n=1 Tax=Pseudonocardia nantongensis TaxID=1181885 RepID=UPI00397E568F